MLIKLERGIALGGSIVFKQRITDIIKVYIFFNAVNVKNSFVCFGKR